MEPARAGGDLQRVVVVLAEAILERREARVAAVVERLLAVAGSEADLGAGARGDAADGRGERLFEAGARPHVLFVLDGDEIVRRQEVGFVALRDDDRGVREDAAVLCLALDDAELLLDGEELGAVAIRVGELDVEARRLGFVSLEEVADARRERVAGGEHHEDADGLFEAVERLERGIAERIQAPSRDVPALVVARDEDVRDDGEHHRRDDADARGELGGDGARSGGRGRRFLARRRLHVAALVFGFAAHPHLHASTARTVTNKGRRISVRSKTSRRESMMPCEKSAICDQTET